MTYTILKTKHCDLLSVFEIVRLKLAPLHLLLATFNSVTIDSLARANMHIFLTDAL